jgi:hypothetical protein
MTAKISRLLKSEGTIRILERNDGSVEWRSHGSVSWRNNNPGNLKFVYADSADKTVRSTRSRAEALTDAQQIYRGIVGLDQWGNAVFETYEAGRAAKIQLLEKKHGAKTVEEMLLSYSTADYTGGTHHRAQADFIFRQADRAGLNLRGKTIQQMDGAELSALADGIKGFEGWKVGETRQLAVAGHAKSGAAYVADNDVGGKTPQPAAHFESSPIARAARHATALESASAAARPDNASHHRHVEVVQRSLRELGYRDAHGHQLVVDGSLGVRTHHAIRTFQHAHHLHPDGIAGKHTLAALERAQHAPLLSEATHPQHALYVQALHGVETLPAAVFADAHARRNAAAALTVAAHAQGLRRIDHVVLGIDAVGLFAVQGGLEDPAHRRTQVDRVQATAQSVEHSTRALEQGTVVDHPALAQARAAGHASERHDFQGAGQ